MAIVKDEYVRQILIDYDMNTATVRYATRFTDDGDVTLGKERKEIVPISDLTNSSVNTIIDRVKVKHEERKAAVEAARAAEANAGNAK